MLIYSVARMPLVLKEFSSRVFCTLTNFGKFKKRLLNFGKIIQKLLTDFSYNIISSILT